jgi:hypothetical protein
MQDTESARKARARLAAIEDDEEEETEEESQPDPPSFFGELIRQLVSQTADTFADRLAWLTAKGFTPVDAIAIQAGAKAYERSIDQYFYEVRKDAYTMDD